ncbi:hypothetical protein IPH67_02870 [bacterium]|nr:MAG: hypothetical protein IPH67_02870 [bacterium]
MQQTKITINQTEFNEWKIDQQEKNAQDPKKNGAFDFAVATKRLNEKNMPTYKTLEIAQNIFSKGSANYTSGTIRLGYIGGGLIFTMFIIDYLNWRAHSYSFKNSTLITPYGAPGIFALSLIMDAWLLDNLNKSSNTMKMAKKDHEKALKNINFVYE